MLLKLYQCIHMLLLKKKNLHSYAIYKHFVVKPISIFTHFVVKAEA